jgi:hypothetical protein
MSASRGCDALALMVVSFALSHVGYAGAGSVTAALRDTLAPKREPGMFHLRLAAKSLLSAAVCRSGFGDRDGMKRADTRRYASEHAGAGR